MAFNNTTQSPAGPSITAQSEVSKARPCVSCGAPIAAGHICECQDGDAVNCPECKRNIPRKHFIAFTSVHLGTDETNLELRLHCPRPGCAGYHYSYAYLSDFVPHQLDTDGKQAPEKADEQTER